jgi:hypothetical protein
MKRRMSVGAAVVTMLPFLLVIGHASPADAMTQDGSRSAAATSVSSLCLNPAQRGFRPLRARVPHVGKNIRVLAMGRLRGGVPAPPPLTSTGKQSFAWDKYGPKPGSKRGNVRFNAHTYPDGSALGNRLLKRLKVGRRIVIYGDGVALCYRVTKRIFTTPRRLGGYYSTTGKPKLAIVVCSGRRLGPGNWTNRTIWYARPSLY